MKTWNDDIAIALRILGGKSTLPKIYYTVGIIRAGANRSIPTEFQALIRCRLQHSKRFVGNGNGHWSLRKRRNHEL